MGGLLREKRWEVSDTSFYDSRIYEERMRTEYELQRPSVLFRPVLTRDGDKFCVLYGQNLMDGCAGFGDTVDAAMRDFDNNWARETARSSDEKWNNG